MPISRTERYHNVCIEALQLDADELMALASWAKRAWAKKCMTRRGYPNCDYPEGCIRLGCCHRNPSCNKEVNQQTD
jgi:hypothetical protein